MAENNNVNANETKEKTGRKKPAFKAKGEAGYIDSKKKYELIMALAIFAVAAAIFVIGLALNKWEKGNIFTVIAAIFIIPMARFMTTYIMFRPFRSVSQEKADEVEKNAKPGSIIYADYIMTSEKKAMMLAFLVVTSDKLIGVLGREQEDVLDVRNYLQDMVTRRGYDYKVTIAEDYPKFFSLLKGSDCVADLEFENEEAKEEFDKERAALCGELESIMP